MANSLSLESKYLAKIVLTHQKVLSKFVYTICLKKNLNDVEKKNYNCNISVSYTHLRAHET